MSGDDDLPVPGYVLKELDPHALRHPADRAATAALNTIPGVNTVARKLIELGYERQLRQILLASSVRLSPQQLPEVYERHRSAYTTLDLPEVPQLYLAEHPLSNAATGIGLRTKITLELGSTHPLSVKRAHELMDWVKSGDYERIRDGVHPRRGAEDPNVRAEAKAAAEHYREKFQGAFKDVAGQAEGAARSVSDWLSKNLGDKG